MLTENRKYHYIASIKISKSKFLDSHCLSPAEDKTNWFFMKVNLHQFSFILKIEDPLKAQYNIPFKARLSFIMIETVKKKVLLNYSYKILRGQENIGEVTLIEKLD